MFQFERSIANVRSFEVFGSDILYCDKEGHFKLNKQTIDKDADLHIHTIWERQLLYVKGSQTISYSLDNNSRHVLEKSLLLNSVFDGTALFSYNFNVKNFTLSYDRCNLAGFSECKFFMRDIHIRGIRPLRTGYLLTLETCVAVTDNDGQFVWETTISNDYVWRDDFGKVQILQIQRIIGIFENLAWISLNSGRMLAFNLDNGKIEFDISRPINETPSLNEPAPDGYQWFGTRTQMDEKSKMLFGLAGTWYWEIMLGDPPNNFIAYDLTDTCKENKIEASMPVLEWPCNDNEIYFGDSSAGNHKVGVFDRLSRKIIWTTNTEKPGSFLPGVLKITYENNRLYVLDGNYRLNIYQRQIVK